MFWEQAVSIWNGMAKWQRQLSTLFLFLFGFWFVIHFVIWPFEVQAAREHERLLDRHFQTMYSAQALLTSMAPIGGDTIDSSLHQVCIQQATSANQRTGPIGVFELGGPDPLRFETIEAYLACSMNMEPERLCDASRRRRLIANVRTYLAILEDTRSTAVFEAALEQLQPPGLRRLASTFDQFDVVTAGDEVDDAGRPLTPKEIEVKRQTAVSERRAALRRASRVDGPPASFDENLQTLARQGYIAMADFGNWFGLDVPSPIAKALNGISTEESPCS